MGLLDGLFDSEQGRMGLGLLAAGSARGDGAGFGQRLSEAVGSVDQWKKAKAQAEYQKQQQEFQQFQMEQAKAQAMAQMQARQQAGVDDAAVRGAFSPMDGGRAMANGQGPTMANAQNIGQVPQFDPRQFLANNPQASLGALRTAMETNSAINPAPKRESYGPDQTVGEWTPQGFKELFKTGSKPKEIDPNKPFMMVGGKIVPNEAYQAFDLKSRKAGATNVSLQHVGPKAFETELGKMDAEQLGKWRESAMAAQSTLGSVQRLENADAKGAYSGGAANLKMTVGSYINGLTGATPKGQVGSELYTAEASNLVLSQVKALGANPSNADVIFIQKTVPQLSTNAEARKALTQFMREKAQGAIGLYQRANAHARKNSGLGGFEVTESNGGWSITPVGQ